VHSWPAANEHPTLAQGFCMVADSFMETFPDDADAPP
jgi:hypothetical protein